MNNQVKSTNSGLLFFSIAILPPFIFMFHLYTKNAEYVNFWHVLILTLAFALCGALFYLLAARIGKSPQGAALVCLLFWPLFFNMRLLYRRSGLFGAILTNRTKTLILIIVVTILITIVFYLSRLLRKKAIYQIIAVFEIVVFLLNCTSMAISFVSKKPVNDSESIYKTSFNVTVDSSSPNIYWFFMDGMLGFKAMEYFFDDPQREFETQLASRGFVVNREAEFEANHVTTVAFPALMCPHYYDEVMLPSLLSKTPSRIKETAEGAQKKNELLMAFNAKGYETNTISIRIGYIFHLISKYFYTEGRRVEKNTLDFDGSIRFNQLNNLIEVVSQTSALYVFQNYMNIFMNEIFLDGVSSKKLKETNIDLTSIYAEYRGAEKWYISALEDIFSGPEPRITIIWDVKAHYPFILDEDGSRIDRTKEEGLDIYNYPPQHRFTRKYLVALIDLILINDPEAVIVVQADHGLHHGNSRIQILASGGTADGVRLIYNQTMSAVRIPEKWGGLDAPLDPLNITRLLVNRYVGQNYKLLESHP